MKDTTINIKFSHKLVFWISISMISTFFAEVLAGSDLFPFFHFWGLMIVVPLYGLHTIILATIIFKSDRPSFNNLFFAGAIFGLYEAYITKILFSPTWGNTFFSFFGVDFLATVVLVLFYHPIMSFIIPLVFTEYSMMKKKEIIPLMPKFFHKKYLPIFFAVIFGAFHAGQTIFGEPYSMNNLVFAIIVNVSLILGVVLFCRHITSKNNYSIKDILPDKKEFRFLLIFLIMIYVFMGFTSRPEALPGIPGHVIMISIYAFFGMMFYEGIKKSQKNSTSNNNAVQKEKNQDGFSWLFTIVYGLSLMVSYILFSFTNGIASLISCWIIGPIIGFILLIYSIRKTFLKKIQI